MPGMLDMKHSCSRFPLGSSANLPDLRPGGHRDTPDSWEGPSRTEFPGKRDSQLRELLLDREIPVSPGLTVSLVYSAGIPEIAGISLSESLSFCYFY